LIGIYSQNIGPTCKFWANPVTVTFTLGRAGEPLTLGLNSFLLPDFEWYAWGEGGARVLQRQADRPVRSRGATARHPGHRTAHSRRATPQRAHQQSEKDAKLAQKFGQLQPTTSANLHLLGQPNTFVAQVHVEVRCDNGRGGVLATGALAVGRGQCLSLSGRGATVADAHMPGFGINPAQDDQTHGATAAGPAPPRPRGFTL
jgi:hypothetical protein